MNNKELRNRQNMEAIKRLKILEKHYLLYDEVLEKFKKEKTIFYSQNAGGTLGGILFYLHNEKNFVKIVKKFEEDNNALVYHCLLTHTQFGDILDMLYVSDEVDTWSQDCKELQKEEKTLVYAVNLTNNIDSEFGYISITGVNGGICRLY